MDGYINRPRTKAEQAPATGAPSAQERSDETGRIASSVFHLREHLHEVPVLVVPTVAGRTDTGSIFDQASIWGSVIPAVWSLMLALRSRGLGSAWTTLHLHREREAAELLGIPFETHMQVGLFPIAYTRGAEFGRAPRAPVADVATWNGWS
jgi:nitroreductase